MGCNRGRCCADLWLPLGLTIASMLAALPAHAQDSKGNNGSGINSATTVQLPTFGVWIDAEGVLDVKTFSDPGGRLRLERMAAVKADLPADLRKLTKLRKISLRKLEAAIAERLKAGKPLEAELRYLAGLQRVQFAFPQRTSSRRYVILAPSGTRPAPRRSRRSCARITSRRSSGSDNDRTSAISDRSRLIARIYLGLRSVRRPGQS